MRFDTCSKSLDLEAKKCSYFKWHDNYIRGRAKAIINVIKHTKWRLTQENRSLNKEVLILREALKNCTRKVTVIGFMASKNYCEVMGRRWRYRGFCLYIGCIWSYYVLFYRLNDNVIKKKTMKGIYFSFVYDVEVGYKDGNINVMYFRTT